MYTQCTECQQAQTISAEQLRTAHGQLYCEACSTTFDALESLNEGSIPTETITTDFPETINNQPFPSNQQTKFWGLGSSFLLAFLVFQLYFFEGYNLSQNIQLRPWLQKVCTESTNCQLPEYQNLDEISILNGSFEPNNEHYLFKATFINQSLFAQKQPSIKLTLLDFSGRSFSKRTFHPSEYSDHPNDLLKSNQADEITLSIATPSSKIGGYRFELI